MVFGFRVVGLYASGSRVGLGFRNVGGLPEGLWVTTRTVNSMAAALVTLIMIPLALLTGSYLN